MKIAFMGTPEFAVPSLEALCDNGFAPAAVITQPDRDCGRGKKLTMPPAKACAIKRGVPVYQFENVSSPEGVA
ncbi:MAG TPA: methionyl-tRNA formyltransferase, partial [Clostridia bacterium]|nr:methionyl-tRNA formyltransferase [Clostridia bacterium]